MTKEEVNFLQLWIVPEEQNLTPNYEQKLFDVKERVNKFQTLVSPQDNLVEGSLGIHQQASILTGSFDKGKESSYTINKGKGVYVFLLEGEIEVSGETLYKRDALGVWDTDSIIIKSQENSEILLIDVPMI